MADPVFFASPELFRRWLKRHHAIEPELLVGFYKVGTGQPSMTWPQSVDEALCVGWIDGVRRSLGEHAYTIRFTPRRTGSIWSAVNIRRAQAMIDEGRMLPAGLKAFNARTEAKSAVYAFEQGAVELPEMYLAQFDNNKAASTFFKAQPPWYRKTLIWWVVSAKLEATRLKRLDKLIDACAQGLRLR